MVVMSSVRVVQMEFYKTAFRAINNVTNESSNNFLCTRRSKLILINVKFYFNILLKQKAFEESASSCNLNIFLHI
ncbi:hypothetical protein T4B_10732 [Trichinella pseudospiralis]|uniref:Uncharacterized protein n=1 Tax=Trichinella pseudospiralis TaxID=6337 RepID=A0A0V1J713_TRIPS|nr:hypothetical protein T4B_10732 [Trichinella pseudospiralis]KRZ30752.1 hypothetical protein T4C_4009 [Trichinella pseudospiralis]